MNKWLPNSKSSCPLHNTMPFGTKHATLPRFCFSTVQRDCAFPENFRVTWEWQMMSWSTIYAVKPRAFTRGYQYGVHTPLGLPCELPWPSQALGLTAMKGGRSWYQAGPGVATRVGQNLGGPQGDFKTSIILSTFFYPSLPLPSPISSLTLLALFPFTIKLRNPLC